MSMVARQGPSPFDAIRGEDGRWSARQLQGLMGYARWENLTPALTRAMASARNEGVDVDENFLGSQDVTGRRGPAGQDYRLTRHAAYLLAMNGDPNKREVAAAQAYFAVMTHQAELAATVKPLDELELAERQVVLIREKRAALARAVKAEAFQSAIEAGDGLTLRAFHKKYFSEVGERIFMDHLYARGYLIDQRGKGAERDDGTVRDGAQHRHPSAKGKHFFYLHGHGRYGGKRREATRVRPGAPELDLKAALIKDGMAANNNDTGRPLEIEAA